ncbi:MAG: hypothetical protein ABIR36_04820 [Nitrospiraceae bacterium]
MMKTTAGEKLAGELGFLLVLARRVVREQQPAEFDEADRHAGDGEPGSNLTPVSVTA